MAHVKRKLFCSSNEGDPSIRLRPKIKSATRQLNLLDVSDTDAVVSKYLLYKHAWKLLQQLYANASAKKLWIMMIALGDSKLPRKFMKTLKSQTELTKRTIARKYLGDSMFLRLHWTHFNHKLSIIHNDISMNSWLFRLADRSYWNRCGRKFFKTLMNMLCCKSKPIDAGKYLRSLAWRSEIHACEHDVLDKAVSITGERMGSHRQLKTIGIIHRSRILKSVLDKWQSKALGNRQIRTCRQFSRDHFDNRSRRLVFNKISAACEQSKFMDENILEYIAGPYRFMQYKRVFSRLRGGVCSFFKNRHEDDAAIGCYSKNLARNSFKQWRSFHRAIAAERHLVSAASLGQKKRAIRLWKSYLRDVNARQLVIISAIDTHNKRASRTFFTKWCLFHAVKVMSLRGVKVKISSNAKSWKISGQQVKALHQHARNNTKLKERDRLMSRAWKSLRASMQARKTHRSLIVTAHVCRQRMQLTSALNVFIALREEHLARLGEAHRHHALLSLRRALDRLVSLHKQREAISVKYRILDVRTVQFMKKKVLRCLRALIKTLQIIPDRNSRNQQHLSNRKRDATALLRFIESPQQIIEIMIRMNNSNVVRRLGPRISLSSSSDRLNVRHLYMLRKAVHQIKYVTKLNISSFAVHRLIITRYSAVWVRQWRLRVAARALLSARFKGMRSSSLRLSYHEWIMNTRVEKKLSLGLQQKEKRKCIKYFKMWRTYVAGTLGQIPCSEVVLHRYYTLKRKVQDMTDNFVCEERYAKSCFLSFVRRVKERGIQIERARDYMSVGKEAIVRKILRRWMQRHLVMPVGKQGDNKEDSKGARKGCVKGRMYRGERSSVPRLSKSWQLAEAKRRRLALSACCRERCLLTWALTGLSAMVDRRSRGRKVDSAMHLWHSDRIASKVFQALKKAIRMKRKAKREAKMFTRTSRIMSLARCFTVMDRHFVGKWIEFQKMRRAALYEMTRPLQRGFNKLLRYSKRKQKAY